jgi:predicted nucleotidyltransferase
MEWFWMRNEGPGMSAKIDISREKIAEFCRRNKIRRLALFGSVLRDDFTKESDVDVLVEFEPGAKVGYICLAGMENELSRLIGRKVDMNTAGCLSPYFRDEVLNDAEVAYEQS